MRNIFKTITLFFFISWIYSCSEIQPNQPEKNSSQKLSSSFNSVLPSNPQENTIVSDSNTPSTIARGAETVEGSITIKGKIFEHKEVSLLVDITLPVAGAKIELANKSTFSDKDGNYSIPDVPFGKHTLIVSKEGYELISDPKYHVHENFGHLDVSLTLLENVGKKTIRFL